MRKLVYIMLVAAAVASCSKNDVIGEVVGEAISFGDVFVGKPTKAGDQSHTVDNLNAFYVFGNVELNKNVANTVNLYSQVPVTRTTGSTSWNYPDQYIQYWLPGCNYKFAAVSDLDNTNISVTAANGFPQSISYNVAAQKDLLYAEVKNVETTETGVPMVGITALANKTVGFTFNHLLSKVQFEFTNKFASSTGVNLIVTEIQIQTPAGATAVYDLTSTPHKWGAISGNATIDFGSIGTADLSTPGVKIAPDEAKPSAHCYLIPGTYGTMTISFNVNHNKGGSATPKTITMTNVTLQPGYSYNFTAELNSGNVQGVVPIKFEINRGGWSEDNVSVGPDVNEGEVTQQQ